MVGRVVDAPARQLMAGGYQKQQSRLIKRQAVWRVGLSA